jgi:hypothetical protein
VRSCGLHALSVEAATGGYADPNSLQIEPNLSIEVLMSETIELRKLALKKTLETSGETLPSFILKRAKESGMPEKKLRELSASLSESPEDFMLEFIARLPKKAFISALAIFSGINIPEEKTDAEAKIKAWLKKSKTDVRAILKEGFSENVNYEEDDPEEIRRVEELLTSGTDDEVIQYFIDNLSEEQKDKMMSGVEFFELFDEEEAGPPESPRAVMLAMIERQYDKFERTNSKEHGQKLDYIFGATREEMAKREFSDEEESTDTEDELIEILNWLEYQRDEGNKPSIVKMLFRRQTINFESGIRDGKKKLTELQGGTLDRFGLRNLSAVELEHLIETTQEEIEALEASKSQKNEAIKKIAEHFNAPSGLSDLVTLNPFRYELYVKKRLLPELKLKLKLKQTAVISDTPRDRAARVASEVQEMNETIRLLEQQCEEDVKKHPEHEAETRRRYRMAIDALKEKT